MPGLLDQYLNGGLMPAFNDNEAWSGIRGALPQASPGIFGQLGNSQGSWGPMLMALGAGLASGGAAGGGGWGAGIGKGLGLATTVGQNQRNNALRQQQLQATLQHQQIMENLGLLNAQSSQMNAASQAQNATTSAETRRDAIGVREQEARRREAELAGPVSLIAGGAPRYQQAKQDLINASTSGRVWGSLTGGGKSGQALNTIKSIIMGAAKINGVKPEDLYDTMLPTSFEDAGEKLQNLEAYVANTQGLVKGYPTLAPQIEKFQPIFTPPEPKLIPVPTTSIGAPQQGPVQAGAASGPSQGPLPFEKDPARRQPGQVYNFPNGAQAIWQVFPNGVQGWEPIQ